MSFPDCKSIEIHHWWASPPSTGTVILEQAMRTEYFPHYLSLPTTLGLLDGLSKLERLSLEGPPELNTTILVQLLSHQDSLASNLTHLELRFCNLDLAVTAKLLQQATRKLTHLTLLLRTTRTDTIMDYIEEGPHLCPLVRHFCKNLVCLEYAAPTICREIFFDDDELREIRKNCNPINPDQSDEYAIRQTVIDSRRRWKTQHRKERVQKALREAGKNSDARIEMNTELLLDREEEARNRLINSSRFKWKRKIISWGGTCTGRPWSELEQGADLAEAGVEWTLLGRSRFGRSYPLPSCFEDFQAYETQRYQFRSCYPTSEQLQGAHPVRTGAGGEGHRGLLVLCFLMIDDEPASGPFILYRA